MSLEKSISKLTEVIKAAGMTGMTGTKPVNQQDGSNGVPAGCTCDGPVQMGLCQRIRCGDGTVCMLIWDDMGMYYKCNQDWKQRPRSASPM